MEPRLAVTYCVVSIRRAMLIFHV